LDSDTSLQVLSLPSLTNIYGAVRPDDYGLYLRNLSALSQLDLPKLSRIVGYAYVADIPLICREMQPDWPELTGHNPQDHIAAEPCGTSN
jgi:hypothetical protein